MVYLGGLTQKLTALLSLLFLPLFFLIAQEVFGIQFPLLRYMLSDAQITRGEVVSSQMVMEEMDGGEVTRRYYANVQFENHKGKAFTVTDYTHYSDEKIKNGERVRVIYDPDNPYDAHTFSTLQALVTMIIVGALAIVAVRLLTSNLFFNPSPYK